jgi:phosphatidylglycerophosphatase A
MPGPEGEHHAGVPAITRVALILASLGPLGFSPLVPATVASLAIAIGYAFLPPLDPVVDALIFLAVTPIALWAADHGERAWGHDARHIVIDEGAGMAATLFALPAGRETAVLAFFAFRVFDVFKPFPGRRAEKLPGGLGVVADDVVAGIYANLAVRVMLALMARAPAA